MRGAIRFKIDVTTEGGALHASIKGQSIHWASQAFNIWTVETIKTDITSALQGGGLPECFYE